MTTPFDLNILPLLRRAGQELTELPDLYVVTPPRRAARGREEDSLIIYLSMAGNAPLTPEQHTQLMERLAQKFYKTTGSLTAALRSLAEALNLHLLDRNLRSSGAGKQGIGLLVLGVLRGDTFYMAQCGPVHLFVIGQAETQHLHDPQSSGRGLGLSRTTPVRFMQARVNAGDFVVLSSASPASWTASNLKHPHRLGIDGMRRGLQEHASLDYNAVLIHVQAGTGKVRLLRRKTGTPGMAHATPAAEALPAQPQESSPQPAAPAPLEDLAAEAEPLPAPIQPPAVVTLPAPPPAARPQPSPAPRLERVSPPARSTSSPAQAVRRPAPSPRGEPRRSPAAASALKGVFTSFGRALGNVLTVIGSALGRLLKNMLPDEGVLNLSPSTMIFIALAVPLVLSIVGGTVYAQRGRLQQHQLYYEQAVNEAAYAASLTDPVQQRQAWQAVLDTLDKAEFYTTTGESRQLRLQTTAILDGLDGVVRATFQPAIAGGLDDAVLISHMVATTSDLYMLNASQGSVLKASSTPGAGYEIDPNFQCGPSFAQTAVGPLVDIVEAPPGSIENAVILGMDASGNLQYCPPVGTPLNQAPTPPNTGFGQPTALTIEQGNLYILDPKVNAVWIYWDMAISNQPQLFFGNEVPPMQDVIDLVVYNDLLYLLHADGHLTRCSLGTLDTTCTDPFEYKDGRTGRQGGAVISDAVFNQMHYSSFPEHAIYMLDSHNQAVYYFSVLFNLQWQYRAREVQTDQLATAFAVSPNRLIFMAYGDQVLYAAMP